MNITQLQPIPLQFSDLNVCWADDCGKLVPFKYNSFKKVSNKRKQKISKDNQKNKPKKRRKNRRRNNRTNNQRNKLKK